MSDTLSESFLYYSNDVASPSLERGLCARLLPFKDDHFLSDATDPGGPTPIVSCQQWGQCWAQQSSRPETNMSPFKISNAGRDIYRKEWEPILQEPDICIKVRELMTIYAKTTKKYMEINSISDPIERVSFSDLWNIVIYPFIHHLAYPLVGWQWSVA